MAKAPHLANLKSIPGVEWHAKDGVLEVMTPHALARAVGYIKYAGNREGRSCSGAAHAVPDDGAVALPGGEERRPMYNRVGALKKYLQEVKEAFAFLGNTPDYTFEPLLQHYGIRTRWLDLVDNFWTALWFGCQEARSTGELQPVPALPAPAAASTRTSS